MATLEATGELLPAELFDLTAGLYRFMLEAEPVLRSTRPPGRESLDRLLTQARELSSRYDAAWATWSRQWDEARTRVSQQWEEARTRAGQQWSETRLGQQWNETRTRAGQQWNETRTRAIRQWDETRTRVETVMGETSGNLRTLVTKLDAMQPQSTELVALWRGMGRNYEALRVHARKMQGANCCPALLGHIKPRNLTRNLFHVGMGLLAVVAYQFLLNRFQAVVVCAALLGVFLLVDLSRRFSSRWNGILVERVFGRFSRPGEAHRIPASTWYLAAMLLGTACLPRPAISLGVLILAFGDPVASLVGKQWGRRKLWRQKSWVGSFAFFITALAISSIFLIFLTPDVGAWRGLWVASAAALAGTLAELFSGSLDDNFSIPLLSGGLAALLLG